MAKRPPKNPEKYCRVAWNCLTANKDSWGDPESFRPITRIMYDQVFCSGYDRTLGLVSKRALELPKSKRCSDHYLSPQFIGRMVMDNQERFLNCYENFRKIFYLSRRIIDVTKPENTALSVLTHNAGGADGYSIYEPTDKKYDRLGIKLVSVNQDPAPFAADTAPYEHPLIAELLDYEKRFLTEMPLSAQEKLQEKKSKLSGF